MNIVEQNRNQYTKERTELEAYLTRIIQRFFDIKNNETKESIEAMITESLTRLKRDFYHLKTLVFHFNEQTGHIKVDISTVGGEPAFEKHTAFNKDFGVNADTICEGNDSRLSDDRTPLFHVHTVADIDAYSLIASTGVLYDNAHSHLNKEALDVINYTGISIRIDLAIIEQTVSEIQGYYETIRRDGVEIQSDRNTILQPLLDAAKKAEDNLKTAQALLSSADSWLSEARMNVDNKAAQLTQYLNNFLLSTEQAAYESANKSVYLFTEGTIDLANMDAFKNVAYSSDQDDIDTRVAYTISTDISTVIPAGHKLVYVKANIEYEKRETYIGMNDDGNLASMTRYSKRVSALPLYYMEANQSEPFLLSHEYDENGNVRLYCTFLVHLPSICKEVCKLGNKVIFRTDGVCVQNELEQSLGLVASFADISTLSQTEKTTLYNILDSLPYRDYYLIDGQYQYIYDIDGNITDEGWFNSQGEKIDSDKIDWELGIYDEYPGCYLMLKDNNKVISVYTHVTNIERDALISISPSAISGYMMNPKIRYQVYCRKE